MGRAVVFGLARSGIGAANLLCAMGRDVTVTDAKSMAELSEAAKKLSPSIKVAAGGHPPGMLDGADLVVLSPGVPSDIEPLRRAREAGIEVIGELELAGRVMGWAPFYTVTGTNGKSTTTTLLDLMMKKSGRRTLLGGNIGNALTWEAFRMGESAMKPGAIDCVVAEVSSFQLETISSFRPAGAAVLNVTPDHMDRYRSLEEYASAKARIAMNQTGEDFLVLNADDTETARIPALAGNPETRVFYFSRKREVDGVFLKGETVVFGREPLIRAGDIGIKGVHNLENAMAAAAMAVLAGCSADAVSEALREFGGLEHRLEFVRSVKGVSYVNDSKGTNVGAVLKSLESFSSPIVLIAGGRDKNGDFGALAEVSKGRVKEAVLIGEARGKMEEAMRGAVGCVFAESLEEAVAAASRKAVEGDVVLLSPACASFDMFSDFEDRGRRFKEIVRRL